MAKKYHQGVFRPLHPEKYAGNSPEIIFRSSWEQTLMRWCDNTPSVIGWMSEEIVIPYYSQADMKMRKYYVDFAVKFKTNQGTVETVIIEVKPFKETIPPKRTKKKKDEVFMKECYTWQVNQDKWKAANEWAEKRGLRFIVMDEYALGIKNRPGK